jgi:hypothetical protein
MGGENRLSFVLKLLSIGVSLVILTFLSIETIFSWGKLRNSDFFGDFANINYRGFYSIVFAK